MTCGSCGFANELGRKFCGECGAQLARACPACGTANTAAMKFCGECGATLGGTPPAEPLSTPAQLETVGAPVAERRLVSVLFADLVGFTTASEGRDPEETRELLSRYFDASRTIVERYGGTVEKFIGDAVMAVWGAPVANEDDAERAVRAALDLLAAVPHIDPALRARAGVLTGEAAVTLGAQGQGMVAGDLVNTASRVQAAAEPGTVFVGEPTRRATESAIAYESAGRHELKGKAEPIELSRALRVVAARGGEGRSAQLEAPFVGRDRELRLVKQLFHTTADEGRAHLLSVVGVAGIGKSRLVWEFEKYLDGLAESAWWHRGRCLAYGDGVAYWALAEMVRMRARIAEDEPAEDSLRKLQQVVAEIVLDPEERGFVEPRLQHLLGLTERTAPDREDLFSAWRLFVERMADDDPVILVFEDIQWADASLVEFLEYLLDWSRNHPIYVITLARPEVFDRYAGWGATARSFTSLSLEPLSVEAVDALLRGLVPGLPDEAVARIRERADGIPLYAVETVRMLLDRGLLTPEEGGYGVVGPLGGLDVPETLHALIAARLDGLAPGERRLLQDAAVLGKTFSPRGLAALSGTDEDELRASLAALVRKEVLYHDADPRSPERGQYGFLQALVQRVAYETLARRDRKAKHVAAARYLADAAGIDPDEIAEVIAAHLLDAQRAGPDDADAGEIRSEARDWLTRAAERAAGLAATEDAQRAFEAAADLSDAPLDQARLLERAGTVALSANDLDSALGHMRRAHELCMQAGATHDGARVAAALGLVVWRTGSIEEALRQLEDAYAVLAGDEPDGDVAKLAAELGRLHYFAGDVARAGARIEEALETAEALELPAVLSAALNTKSMILMHRRYEAEALMRQALKIALDHDLVFDALRAYNNLLVLLDAADRPEETLVLTEEGLGLARRRGDRFWELRMAAALVEEHRWRGDVGEAAALVESLAIPDSTHDAGLVATVLGVVRSWLDQGDVARARESLERLAGTLDEGDIQQRGVEVWRQALAAEAAGRLAEASALLVTALDLSVEIRGSATTAEALKDLADLALRQRSHEHTLAAAAAVETLPPSARTRAIASQLHRLQANAAAAEGDHETAAERFALALAAARNLGFAFWLAPVLRDYGAWLVAAGRTDEAAPLLAEARELFERMGAVVWLEWLDALPSAALEGSAAGA
jgi:class 3 adenylate cyclase